MTTADRLREQGHSRGIVEGRDQGRSLGIVEGQAALLARQLTRRFGPLSAAIHERLGSAGREDLESWADRVLEAASIEDVFGA